MDELSVRKAIVQTGAEISGQGLVRGTGGNISVRVGDRVLCTPTGVGLGELSADNLSLVTMEGQLESGARPTKELPMHLGVYKARPDVTAVVHTHSIYATTYACSAAVNSLVPIYVPSLLTKVGRVKLVPFGTPGSDELGQLIAREIVDHNALLLQNHGVLLTGSTLERAVIAAYEVEDNLKVHFLSHETARPLQEDWVADILHKYA